MTDAKDPVCGMTVKVNDTSITSSHNGVHYYFCSEKCKTDFDEDPDAVLVMEAAREKTTEDERSTSLGIMIDEVAHELRNPLTSIGGFARKVYKRLPLDDPNKEYIEMIINDAVRAENMINKLVELNAMGSLSLEPSNVNNIIHDAVKLFKKELEHKKVKFELELKNNLPLILLDSKKTITAIAHLIRNAIEAMGKTPMLLKISSLIRNEQVEITISDTGKGIPRDKIKYIFDPLYTSKIYGPGLGLTFTKRIVHEHNGKIAVKSEPGQGAVFTISLPLKSS